MDLQLESAIIPSQLEPAAPAATPTPADAALRRVYHVSFVPVIAGAGILGLLFLLGIVFGRPASWLTLLLLAVGLAAVLGVTGLLSRAGARLELSPKGISYATLGYHIHAPWESVAGIGVSLLGGGRTAVLVLRQKAIVVSKSFDFWLGMAPLARTVTLVSGHAGETVNPDGTGYIIPIGLFHREWERGELKPVIRHYAPQAFDPPSA